MVPTSNRSGMGRMRAASAVSRARAARNSAVVATIGNITVRAPPAAASSRARNCRRSTAGRSSPTRRLRQPIAGFSSSGVGLPGSSLSPPRSSVRNTTGRPAGRVEHPGVDRRLLGHVRHHAPREHGDLGAEQADAVGAGGVELAEFER